MLYANISPCPPRDNSPLSASSQLSPDSFKTNIHRNKTKRWVEAPKADYGGGGWGDEDDDEDNNGNGKPPPPPQKEYLETTSNAAAGHGATPRGGPLLRQNSFERGDDDTVIPPMDHVTSRRFPPILGDSDHHDKGLPHGQPQQEQLPAHHTQQINVDPPIPRNQSVFRVPVIKRMETAGTDESELEPYQQPHQSGITSRELAVSPVVDVSPPLQELRDRFAEPSLTPKHTLYEDSSRIPLALVAPGVDSTPVPLQVFTATADLQNFGSLLALEDNVKAPNYGNIDKPTPPLPPPEDTSLETISEHGSPVLSPRQEPRPSRKWDKTPSYDDYEDGYYDDNTISHVSPSQPLYSSLLPSIQPDPPAFILPHEAMATHKQKILRPADIYKRHQEELSLRSGEDSARFSADPTMRPCIDASGPLTSEPERIRSHQSSNPVNSQPSRRESSEELSGSSESTSRLSSKQGSDQGGDFSRSRSRSGGRAFAVPLSQNTPTLDSLPSIPLGSLDPKISPDIISGYSISPTDTDGKLDYFASTADPKLAYHQADNDSAEKTSRESRFGGIEDIEGNALIHNPPTAATQGATSSPLSPDKHPEISSLQECLLAPLVSGLALGTINQTDGQTLPPGELQGGVTNLSTPKVVPPLNQAVACHSDENPSTIIHSGVRSLDKDDLDTFIVELERAQTPDLRPSDTPKQQPSIGDLRDENTSLYAPRSPYTTLESTGAPPVYYQEDDETQYIQSSLYTQTVHPRPHIQGVPVSVGEHKGEIKPVDYSHGGSGPLGRPPSPKPMEIPVSMRASENPEEPATPASSVDDELLDMISAGRRFLDRRTTEPSAVSLEDRNNGDVDKPQTPTIKGNKMIAKSAIDVDFDSIQATSPTRSLGPESEGIEVINGPTVERRQTTAESQNTSTENEYANELVNQFCRPQTLVLKDTVPMPAGTLLMPPMPPLSGMADSEAVPEVVNFDKDDADCLEPLSHVAPGLELAHHQRGFELLPTLPPPPPHDHQDRLQTAHTTTTTAIFEDINTITTIKNSLERTQAYDALRHKIMNAPNPLLEWTVHQIQQNNGNALLCTELVKIRPGHSLKKSKIDMGRADHQDDGTAHRAEEKLERMGRGAMKLGEKAGGKVGSWMKRVGKKV